MMDRPKTPPPMPTLPADDDLYTATQWAVLLAIFDAVIPSLVPASSILVTDGDGSGDNQEQEAEAVPDEHYEEILARIRTRVADPPSDDVVRAYLAERPAKSPAFRERVRQMLESVPPDVRKHLGGVLQALSTSAGSFVLTGSTTPIHKQSLRARTAVLRSWGTSWFGTPQLLFKSFTLLAKASWLVASPLFLQVSGFPDVPHNWRPGPTAEYEFLQFPPAPAPAPAPAPEADADADGVSSAALIETDVVIVGSGCGGGVCAKVLAEAGLRVVVVDKGYSFAPSELPLPQAQGQAYLYENGGVVQTADSSVSMVAGSCWGGGGTVNWSASLQTQGFVRREWAEKHGLPLFESPAFQESLDRVCDLVGAGDSSDVRQSHRGAVILDGAHRLGWHARKCPQNCRGAEHWCGHCHLGCGSGEKQGPAVSWLPAAARAGAQFIEGFTVDRILWADGDDNKDGNNNSNNSSSSNSNSNEKRAVGVTGRWVSRDTSGSVAGPLEERTIREVVIKAKRVIVSAGSLNSPLLLTRSGLNNRHIGRNLHVHPVLYVGAYYKEDIRPWEGGIITSLCSSFEDLDGQGHGVRLEGMCMVPYAFLSQLPWAGGLDFKLAALRYRHMDGFIALTRDRDAGRVSAGPDGRPRVEYSPSAFDAAHTLEGVLAIAQLCYVTGAEEIRAFMPGARPFIRRSGDGADTDTDTSTDTINNNSNTNDDDDVATPEEKKTAKKTKTKKAIDLGIRDPAFQAWLAELRDLGGPRAPTAPFCSAHQMGSCRMSSHAGEGVVDPAGRVWGADGLYVADASVFPSASGVNPMVTTMAIADWIARGVVDDMLGV